MRRRILAILVTALMVFQTIPGSVFADTGAKSSAQQIGAYYQVNDETGALPGTPGLQSGATLQNYDKNGPVSGTGAVQVDKTIAATDTENVFDVTLKVSTTEKFDQTVESADAATVIVIDCSGSMANGSRMKSAKEAATSFVSGFATDVPNVSRKVAVVAFSGYEGKDVHGAYVVQGWTDASNAATVNSKINGLNAYGGTNIEAGLLLANNLLSSSAVAGISNKNVILLSDGVPSYGVTDNEMDEACDFANGIVCRDSEHMDGDGSSNNGNVGHNDHKDVGTIAQSMKSKAKTYAVYVGGANDMINCSGYNSCSLNQSVSSWLSGTCGFTTYTTSDVEQLVNIFANILRIIEMKAEAWIVTDPMGQHIDFVQANRPANPVNEFSYRDGTLTWDIKSGSIATTSKVNGQTVYTYTLPYRIKLDNLNKTYVDGKYYNTNGVTGLTYLIEESNNGEKEYFDDTAYFNIPSVRDYAGEIEFTKQGRTADGSLANLSGAEFKLEHSSDCGCGYTHSGWTVTSGSDGKVEFSNIPSGHRYVLTETSVPNDNYMKSEGSYTFDVSYGQIIPVSNTLIKDGVVVNERIIDIPVEKVWNDGSNEYGKRPASITVNLLANGSVDESKVITAADGWEYTFTDKLEFDANGNRINYTVTENAVTDYKTEITGSVAKYFIKNTLLTDISGSKTWNDEDNQDGIRPQTITVKLLANGSVTETKSVTEADGWSWTFADRPVYDADGDKISYTIKEDAVEGYTTKVNGYDVTNTHIPETVNIDVQKIWNDADDQDGIRPPSATVQLYSKVGDAAKVAVGEPVEISAAGNGQHTWSDLPRKAGGKTIEYTVEELNVPDGYTVSYGEKDGVLTVTNTHEPAVTAVNGAKTWNDDNNRDGVRPESITINLLADGQTVEGKSVTVTENDGWKWIFDNLPKFNGGKEIVYTVSEDAVDGYSSVPDGMNVTNSYTPGETSVTVNKIWDDADNQDGIRPTGATVQLMADGKPYGEAVTLSGNWTHTWENLPEYKSGAVGQKVVYTVEELDVAEGYDAVYGGEGSAQTITNKHVPATVDVSGSKTWADEENQDGVRPASITINLLADGQLKDSKTVTAEDGWAWTWEDLPKYSNGEEITYTITENPVTNYNADVNGYDVTNTHEPFKTSVSVAKVWSDGENQDGIRPAGIQVKLMANGQYSGTTVMLNDSNGWVATVSDLDKYADGKEIKYGFEEIAVDGYKTTYSVDKEKALTTITNTHVPATVEVSGSKTWDDADNQDGVRPESITVKLLANGVAVDGKVQTVSAEDGWAWSFVDLPKYDKGTPITYTVAEFEVKVADYTTTYDGMNVANEHTPEETAVTVNKVWDDADDQDGLRPDDIKLQLLADGKAYGDAVTVKADEEGTWTYTWTELPKYADGEEIVYTAEEITVDGYDTAYTKDADTGDITVTNTHKPATVEVSGSKTWVDNDNAYKTRPDSIEVILKADGVETDRVTVTEEDGWAWSFENLPKYKNHGTEIVYSIAEEAVEGYASDVEGYDVTNTLEPGVTEVAVEKVWKDADNQDGIRPESVTFKLLANGEDTGKTVVVDKESSWKGAVSDIPKYDEDCVLIQYTFEESAVEGYEVAVEGDMNGGFTVTNTHEIELIDAEGSKTWNDADNQDGIRPEAITVNLLADGKVIDTAIVTEEDGWAWSFKDLPKFAAGEEGRAIEYTVSEEAVEGYTPAVNGFDITNTHEVELTKVEGSKTWDDADNQDGIRPASITVNLLANGEIIDTANVTEADDWAWSFTELPVYEAGKVGAAIEYTVSEETVEGYTAEVNGFDITNTHEVELTKVEGSKTWDDADNQDGKRPESISINLLANGEVIDTAVVTAEDDWAWSFKDLPVYEAGKVGEAINYTITEDPVEGYNTVVDGYDVINKQKTPAIAGLDGVKVLNGADLTAGMFKFALADADGKVFEVVTNDENGFFTFTEFKFDAAGTYTYLIAEVIPYGALEFEEGVYVKDGILYDATLYTYTVEVVENEEGNFEIASASLTDKDGTPAEQIIFVNEDISGSTEDGGGNDPYYEEDKLPNEVPDKFTPVNKPDKSDKDDAPQTGDDFNMGLMALIGMAALAIAGLSFRRKSEE